MISAKQIIVLTFVLGANSELRIGYWRIVTFTMENMSRFGNFQALKEVINLYDIMLLGLKTTRETMEIMETCVHPMEMIYTTDLNTASCAYQPVVAIVYRSELVQVIKLGRLSSNLFRHPLMATFLYKSTMFTLMVTHADRRSFEFRGNKLIYFELMMNQLLDKFGKDHSLAIFTVMPKNELIERQLSLIDVFLLNETAVQKQNRKDQKYSSVLLSSRGMTSRILRHSVFQNSKKKLQFISIYYPAQFIFKATDSEEHMRCTQTKIVNSNLKLKPLQKPDFADICNRYDIIRSIYHLKMFIKSFHYSRDIGKSDKSNENLTSLQREHIMVWAEANNLARFYSHELNKQLSARNRQNPFDVYPSETDQENISSEMILKRKSFSLPQTSSASSGEKMTFGMLSEKPQYSREQHHKHPLVAGRRLDQVPYSYTFTGEASFPKIERPNYNNLYSRANNSKDLSLYLETLNVHESERQMETKGPSVIQPVPTNLHILDTYPHILDNVDTLPSSQCQGEFEPFDLPELAWPLSHIPPQSVSNNSQNRRLKVFRQLSASSNDEDI